MNAEHDGPKNAEAGVRYELVAAAEGSVSGGANAYADYGESAPSGGIASPAGEPAPLCLLCDYDLRGLAAPGRCPECGTEFDGDTRVWRKRGNSGRSTLERVFYLFVVAQIFQGLVLWLGLYLAVFLTLFQVVVCLITWRSQRSLAGNYVGASQTALVVRDLSRVVVPWGEVAFLARQKRAVTVFPRSSPPIRIDGALVGPAALDALFEEIRRRAPHARPRDERKRK